MLLSFHDKNLLHCIFTLTISCPGLGWSGRQCRRTWRYWPAWGKGTELL